MLDPVDPAKAAVPPPPVVPPRGFAGILDDYDPTATFDTSEYSPGQVFLNVYDLGDSETFRQVNLVSTANNNLLLGGIFHGGIEVYGSEWCYGATEEGRSGVQRLMPRSHPRHCYRTTVPLGKTSLCEPEVEAVLERFSAEWWGSEYDFIEHNCLSFCNALGQELGVNRIPGWVDRAQRVAGGACKTARLARAATAEVEQTVMGALPEVEQTVRNILPEVSVDTDEAQRMASEAVQTLRRESFRAMEAVSAQTHELAEVTQAHAQVLGEAVQAHTQVLGEKAQELLGDDISVRAQELGEKTQEQARAIGSSLWQWGQDLQRAASRALREDSGPQGRANDLWDTALLGGLLGSEPSRRPDLERRREARKKKKEQRSRMQQDDWRNSELLQRTPVPEPSVGAHAAQDDAEQATLGSVAAPPTPAPLEPRAAPAASAASAEAPGATAAVVPAPAAAAAVAAAAPAAAAACPGAEDDDVAADDQE